MQPEKKSKYKENSKKISRYYGKIFHNIIQHELQCKTPTACSEGFENNVETTQVGKQSTDIQLVSSQSEVSNSALNWEKACKYCEKPFTNKLNYEKHVAVCEKLYCEKCYSIFETQKKYTNHLRSCNEKQFVCLTCKKELKRSDSLLNHARLHYPNGNSFHCLACSSKCLTEKELQMHIVEEHIAI